MSASVWRAAVLIASGLPSACALTPQQVTLRPELNVARTDIGRGASVAVTVHDKRPTRVLGFRGEHGTSAKIVTDQDIAAMLLERIGEGLIAYDFKPLRSSESVPRSLHVELRSLYYNYRFNNSHATLKVVAINKEKTYENIYLHYRHYFFGPGIEQIINKALFDALQKLFEDKNLFAFLAGE